MLRGYRERGEDEEVPLDLYAYDDDGELVGGIVADTWGGWLAIDLVWVREDQRGSGLGSDLLRRIEERARDERGCVGVRLDTWGFQAKPFYEKQGYTVFGVLEDYPPGETEYLLQAPRLSGTGRWSRRADADPLRGRPVAEPPRPLPAAARDRGADGVYVLVDEGPPSTGVPFVPEVG